MLKLYTFICFVILIGCKSKERITPTEGPISESVYASGIVKAEKQYKVFADVSGIVQIKHKSIGELVAKGDPIYTIDNVSSHLSTENAELAVRKSREGLTSIQELKRQSELAKNRYLQDSLMYVRQKNLWSQNVGTKVDLEQRELALQSSRISYRNSITDLNQARTNAQADIETAKNNLQISKKQEDNYVVKSEMDGKIFEIYPEEGESVTAQTVLAVVGKPDQFYIEVEVDENDIAKVKKDQPIFITMDSYKDQVFEAVVTKVHPYMDESTGTFTVEGVFVKPPSKLFPNLTLESNILIRRKDKAMIIPRNYLIEDTYVLTKPDTKVKVKVGLKNFEYAEIISGITKDQYIYKP